MKKDTYTITVGRDARTGEFKTPEWARNHPGTAIVQRITIPVHPPKK